MCPEPEKPQPDASQQVAEAHGLLKQMREQISAHPELDQAIEKLEMALSILTTNTGGML
jgi:hypothetical protein